MFADIAAARATEFEKYEQAQRLADRQWIEARKRRKNAKRKKVQAPKLIGPTTFKRIKATLSSALTHALKLARLITRNVARLVKIPTVPSPKVHPWLPEVYGAFLDAVADHRLAPMFTLAGYGGMRRGELCGLRWEDVDFANARIVVRQQAILVRGKIVYGPVKTASGQDRIVYLAPTALVMLHGLRDQQAIEAAKFGQHFNPLNLVFVQEDGAAWNPDSVTKLFPKIVAEVGFPRCRLHDLRHFYGSTALSAGVPMEVVSKMLGHSSLAITVEIYSHLQPKGGQAAAAAIDAAIPRKALTTGDKAAEHELGIVDVCGKLLEEEGHTVSRELVTKLVSAVLAHAAAPVPVAA
jgi:integrase